MSYSDEVRRYCGENLVAKARAQGLKEIEFRAGDIHRELDYKNRLPLVCSALGSRKFEEGYRVQRIAVEGPLNGSNTVLRFKILP